RFVTQPGIVLQEEVETGGVTQGHDRRRRKGHDRGIAEAGKVLLGPFNQAEYAHAFFGTLTPGFETNKGDGSVLPATSEAETGYREDRLNNIALFGEQLF